MPSTKLDDPRVSQHQLIKSSGAWRCSVCEQTWKGKPRKQCPGVIVYTEQPTHLKSKLELAELNLQPIGNPVGCTIHRHYTDWLYDPQHTEQLYPYPILDYPGELKTVEELEALNRSISGVTPRGMMRRLYSHWAMFYNPEECPVADPTLPQVYTWNQRPDHLHSPQRLERLNLRPGKAVVRGCCWHSRRRSWVFLYDPDDEGFELLDPTLPQCFRNSEAVPSQLKSESELRLLNRARRESAKAQGCYRIWDQASKYQGEWKTIYLYHLDECDFIDTSLPPCYEKDYSPPELKTEKELKEINLVPCSGVQPRGCVRQFWYGKIQTTMLYHLEDCQWQPSDQFITKTTLRLTYLLSRSWICRIGEPDLVLENPHHHKFKPMQLYSKQRVEAFLANHAEEYSHWLDERDRFIEIFERNRASITAGKARAITARNQEKQLRREQTARCLRCASGDVTPQGFLCAIHPTGLELHQIPCSDWQERRPVI